MPCPQPLKFDDRHSPSALYLFDNADPLAVVTDEIGGSVGNLTLTGGNALRVASGEFHDFVGVLKPTNCYWEAALNAAYQGNGAFSLSMIVEICENDDASPDVYGFASVNDRTGGTVVPNWNAVWATGTPYLTSFAAGTFPAAGASINKPYLHTGVLSHITLVRPTTTTVIVGVNGREFTSGALAASTSNVNQMFRIGLAHNSTAIASPRTKTFIVYCAAWWNRATTLTERQEEYAYTLGNVFPRRTP